MVRNRMATVMLIAWLGLLSAFGQGKQITMNFKNESLSSALKRLEKVSGYKIMFTYEDVEGYNVNAKVKDAEFDYVIQMLLSGKPLSYSSEGKFVNVTLRDPKQTFDNSKRELHGTVVSQEDGLPIIGATVKIMGTKDVTVTDANGKFSFSNLPYGASLIVSYL